MYVNNQKFLILGVSKSGTAAALYLLERNAVCRFYEELSGEKIESAKKRLKERGGEEVTAENIDAVLSDTDVVIISPGVPINHAVAVKAKSLGKRIIGEFEFGYETLIPPFIGVTGTNGKTTTVSLIHAVLQEAGFNSELVGNVGVPLTSRTGDLADKTVFVAEVSSFQLESVGEFKPHISCVLNIAPDHLERHYTMENYVFLKKRIFARQKESEYCVLNFDDETVKSFYSEIRAKVVWVSLFNEVDGAYLKDGALYYKGERIMNADDIPLSGEHNIYNALFAVAVARLMGVNDKTIERAIIGFKGVPYRTQLVAENNGVKFVNDSKATNTASTITAIRAAKCPVVLILGGSEKGESYDKLFEEIKNSAVKHVVLTGRSRRNMLAAADKAGYSDLTVCADFDCAVKIAAMVAKSGDEVLLSPACASFDAFNGYEERGERFNAIVESLN